ncbi:MAG: flavodoxin family protein, partial [Desulfobacteraceae bacterium]
MRVLGISCSPRTGGNTETLIRAALEGAQSAGAEETEFLSLSRKKISACNGCLACLKTGKCSIEDDMQDIYPMLIHADGI